MELIEKETTRAIIGGLIEVHQYWGPGLYEEIYQRSAEKEFELRGLTFVSQLHLPLVYKGTTIGDDLRLDFLVRKCVVVELKVVKKLLPIHEAQLLTYMRLTGARVGLLANFNVTTLREGLKRLVL